MTLTRSWSLTCAFYHCQYHSESAQQTFFLWCPWGRQCRRQLNYSFKLCAYFVPLTGSSTWISFIRIQWARLNLCRRLQSLWFVLQGGGIWIWPHILGASSDLLQRVALLECGSWMLSLSFPVGNVWERSILNLCHYVIAHHSFNSARRCMSSYRATVPCLANAGE